MNITGTFRNKGRGRQTDKMGLLVHAIFMSLPVHVSNGDYLSSYIIVESVNRVGVDEAVSHPNACLYHLFNLPQHLASRKQTEKQWINDLQIQHEPNQESTRKSNLNLNTPDHNSVSAYLYKKNALTSKAASIPSSVINSSDSWAADTRSCR